VCLKKVEGCLTIQIGTIVGWREEHEEARLFPSFFGNPLLFPGAKNPGDEIALTISVLAYLLRKSELKSFNETARCVLGDRQVHFWPGRFSSVTNFISEHGSPQCLAVRGDLRPPPTRSQFPATLPDENCYTTLSIPIFSLITFRRSLDSFDFSEHPRFTWRYLGRYIESSTKEKDIPHEEATQTTGRESLEGREQHKHLPGVWEAEKSTPIMSILR
jgi:hypothetical protein